MGPRLHSDEILVRGDTAEPRGANAERPDDASAAPDERAHPFVDRRDDELIHEVLDHLRPWLRRFFEPEVRGLARIPEGPAMLVANHNAGVLMPDVFILGDAIVEHAGASALPHILAHDVLFDVRGVGNALTRLGAVRASPTSAHELFEAGQKVLVYPGGDREVMRPYRDRHRIVFGPHRGYVRMALREGVPIVPVVTAGAHEAFMVLDDGGRLATLLGLPRWLRVNVLPTVLSLPWGITFGFPPPYLPVPTRIVIDVLPPITFERHGEAAAVDEAYVDRCHQEVVGAMQARLDRIVRTDDVGVCARIRRRWPSAEPVGRLLEGLADGILARSPFEPTPR